jgi:hypothetical protein
VGVEVGGGWEGRRRVGGRVGGGYMGGQQHKQGNS